MLKQMWMYYMKITNILQEQLSTHSTRLSRGLTACLEAWRREDKKSNNNTNDKNIRALVYAAAVDSRGVGRHTAHTAGVTADDDETQEEQISKMMTLLSSRKIYALFSASSSSSSSAVLRFPVSLQHCLALACCSMPLIVPANALAVVFDDKHGNNENWVMQERGMNLVT